MTREELQRVMRGVFADCEALRAAGQAEYAHDERNAFANFERIAHYLHLEREQVLLVYLLKHVDGIVAYVAQGHRSQREDVRGRINDAIVYLCILRGMVEDREHGEAL